MAKPRRVPITLTALRRAAIVAREFNLTLAVSQDGEIQFRSAQGDSADPLPVLDGRSVAANYPRRRQNADNAIGA